MGLTDAGYFASSTAEFALRRGVELNYNIIPNEFGGGEAFETVKKAIDLKLLPALLILRNPSVELDDFTWHWMAVTGYDDEKKTIFVSTYAKEYEITFSRAWVQYRPLSRGRRYFFSGRKIMWLSKKYNAFKGKNVNKNLKKLRISADNK